jgi:hypothetical protein
MDLHCFHPVFFATPRGRYVIPQYVGNLGVAERTSIEADAASDNFTADPSPSDCGHACHVAVKAKDHIFHPCQKR